MSPARAPHTAPARADARRAYLWAPTDVWYPFRLELLTAELDHLATVADWWPHIDGIAPGDVAGAVALSELAFWDWGLRARRIDAPSAEVAWAWTLQRVP